MRVCRGEQAGNVNEGRKEDGDLCVRRRSSSKGEKHQLERLIAKQRGKMNGGGGREKENVLDNMEERRGKIEGRKEESTRKRMDSM